MQHPPKKQQPVRKRKWRLIVLTIAALAFSLAFVLLLPAIRKAFPAQKMAFEVVQSTVRTLGARDASQIECIVIEPDDQSSYTLHMRDGALMLERGGALAAIAEDAQAAILETVTQITVQDTVTEDASEVADQLDAMGFTSPQCRAVVRYADGSEDTFEVGRLVHGAADYYYRWSGAEGIYTCHSGVLETFSTAENLLLPFRQPVIYSSLVDSLALTNTNGTCAFAFANGTSGQLTVPVAYPLTDHTAQTLLTAVNNFRLGAYEAPLTDENRAEYGFDAPLCTIELSQREGAASVIGEDGTLTTAVLPAQTQRFVIGRSEGEFFYTCAYEGDIYFISRFLAETLVQADWQSLISRTPAAMGDSQLSQIVFEVPDATVKVHITRIESVLANNELEVDTGGNLVYLTSVTVNGEEAPQELLDDLLDRLNTFTVEGSIPANAAVDAEPRWRITLVTETGDTRVLEGYPLDVFSDAVAVNGVMCHYVYDEAIDVLMTGLV